ncbi:thiamine-monophosphate kinase [Bordetella pertussis]|nr:thiamine-monophosphate kinase [Bordetella pertussis]
MRRAALGGGDVYELCFTADPAHRQAAHGAGAPVSRIGRILAGQGLRVLDADGAPLGELPGGFDHFSDATDQPAPDRRP